MQNCKNKILGGAWAVCESTCDLGYECENWKLEDWLVSCVLE